jgi:hypothetical protein
MTRNPRPRAGFCIPRRLLLSKLLPRGPKPNRKHKDVTGRGNVADSIPAFLSPDESLVALSMQPMPGLATQLR